MQSNRNTFLRALGLLSLVVAGAGAQAQVPERFDRIEVTGARHDVLAACPAMQLNLQEAMGKAVSLHQITGSYLVQFSLKGDRIDSVHTPRIAEEYRRPLRMAVRSADCQDQAAMQQPQRFAFIVDIKMESDAGGTRTASLSLRPAMGAAQP